MVTVVAWLEAVAVLAWAQARPADFGRQWIRSHPFTIAGFAQHAEYIDGATYQGAGLNTFLAWKLPNELLPVAVGAGLPWHLHVETATSLSVAESKAMISAAHAQYAGNSGWLINDEPNRLEMADTAQVVGWIKQTIPDALVYTNAYPFGCTASKYYGDGSNPGYHYTTYLNDIVNIIQPDVLMYDLYPFANGAAPLASDYYKNMMKIRGVAQQYNKPYWAFIQAFESLESPNCRLPSESDLRFQLFTMLTAGYKGFHYFGYDMGGWRGLVEKAGAAPPGTPTPLYHAAAAANAEVTNLGRALRFLESTDVRYVANTGNETPYGLTAWAAGAGGDPFISGIDIEGSAGFGKDGLLGFFTDDGGERYFMLTNTYQREGGSAEDTAMSFEIAFGGSMPGLLRLNRTTGVVESVALDPDGVLRVTLPGGTGDLFKYDTGTVFVSEPSSLILALVGIVGLTAARTYRKWKQFPEK